MTAAEGMNSIPNYMNVPAALKELGKIEMVRNMDNIYRLDHAVTKAQKTILKVSKAKDRYDEAVSELKNLMEEKKKLQSKELMDAIDKSNRTYEEITEFLSMENR